MAFRGQYEHSLDSKDRLTVPARFRAALAEGVVLSKGLDPCVEVYPTDELRAARRALPRAAQPVQPRGAHAAPPLPRPLLRRELDSAGRVRLPKHLIEHAGLEGSCVVIGVGEYLEIWNAEAWAKQDAEIDADAQIAEASPERRRGR